MVYVGHRFILLGEADSLLNFNRREFGWLWCSYFLLFFGLFGFFPAQQCDQEHFSTFLYKMQLINIESKALDLAVGIVGAYFCALYNEIWMPIAVETEVMGLF